MLQEDCECHSCIAGATRAYMLILQYVCQSGVVSDPMRELADGGVFLLDRPSLTDNVCKGEKGSTYRAHARLGSLDALLEVE